MNLASDRFLPISEFRGEYRWLSNFWPCAVSFDGMEFRSVEHAYQAAKFIERKTRRIIQVQPKPGDAKRLGRRLGPVRADWEDVKVDVMRALVQEKFRRDKDLRVLLMNTNGRELIEGNSWHDNFWGRCVCINCCVTVPNRRNMLGILLMEVRALR